ncbi:MAG: hypothetical protein HC788_04210 [Sphingopyxis sp.]|nr:hypothetical protein [Sphingopyxis sp.]
MALRFAAWRMRRHYIIWFARRREDKLGGLIEAFLSIHTDTKSLIWIANAPIASFSARIALAHSLGLIGEKEQSELNMLRKILNWFAHDFRRRIDDRDVVDIMSNFRELVDFVWIEELSKIAVKFADLPRDQFFRAVLRLANEINNRKWVIENEEMKLREVNWREHYM